MVHHVAGAHTQNLDVVLGVELEGVTELVAGNLAQQLLDDPNPRVPAGFCLANVLIHLFGQVAQEVAGLHRQIQKLAYQVPAQSHRRIVVHHALRAGVVSLGQAALLQAGHQLHVQRQQALLVLRCQELDPLPHWEHRAVRGNHRPALVLGQRGPHDLALQAVDRHVFTAQQHGSGHQELALQANASARGLVLIRLLQRAHRLGAQLLLVGAELTPGHWLAGVAHAANDAVLALQGLPTELLHGNRRANRLHHRRLACALVRLHHKVRPEAQERFQVRAQCPHQRDRRLALAKRALKLLDHLHAISRPAARKRQVVIGALLCRLGKKAVGALVQAQTAVAPCQPHKVDRIPGTNGRRPLPHIDHAAERRWCVHRPQLLPDLDVVQPLIVNHHPLQHRPMPGHLHTQGKHRGWRVVRVARHR